jgi:phosphoadenosine phosphosulfate reductase
MWELIPREGIMPSHFARYCCAVLKETSGKKRMVAIGVRRSESAGRKNKTDFYVVGATKDQSIKKSFEDAAEVYREDLDDSPYGKCRMIEKAIDNAKIAVHPIIEWEDDDIWSYIKDNGLLYNPLYDEGFKRIGCIGCPLAGGRQMRRQFERYPKFEKLYRRACQSLLDTLKAKGKTYYLTKEHDVEAKNGDEIFECWLNMR